MEKRLDGGVEATRKPLNRRGKELTLTQLLLWRGCPVTAPFSPQDASQNRAGVPRLRDQKLRPS